MVTADILKSKLSYIGKRLWRVYNDDIDDPITQNVTSEILLKTQKKLKKLELKKTDGIQKVWLEAKDELKKAVNISRNRRKRKLNRERNRIRKRVEEALESLNSDDSKNKA